MAGGRFNIIVINNACNKLERFSVECRKTTTTLLFQPIITNTNFRINQSELEKMREKKACAKDTTGFGLSYCLRKWCEFVFFNDRAK